MIYKKRFCVAVVCMLAATTFAGLTQAKSKQESLLERPMNKSANNNIFTRVAEHTNTNGMKF